MSGTEKSSFKTNLFLLIFLAIIIVVTILCALFPNVGDLFQIGNWFDKDALGQVNFWIAVGFTMLLCFLGALIPIPIPYPLPITLFASAWMAVIGLPAWGFILLLVAFGAFANSMGDLIDYLIGMGAESVLSQDNPDLQDRWSKIILSRPKAIPGVILIFGLSPLPDSLLMVPLGIVEYDMKKTIFWMYVGRYCMMFIYALAGVFAIDWLLELTAGEGGWVFGVLVLYLIWGMIVFMVKYKPKSKQKKSKETPKKE